MEGFISFERSFVPRSQRSSPIQIWRITNIKILNGGILQCTETRLDWNVVAAQVRSILQAICFAWQRLDEPSIPQHLSSQASSIFHDTKGVIAMSSARLFKLVRVSQHED